LKLNKDSGMGFIDEATLLVSNDSQFLRWRLPAKPERLKSPGGHYIYPAGVRVFAAGYSGLVGIFDVKSGKELWTASPPPDVYPGGVSLSTGGRLMASSHAPDRSSWRMIVVYDLSTEQRVRIHLTDEGVWGLTFSPDESALYAFVEERPTVIAVFEDGCVDPVRTLQLPRQLGTPGVMHFAPDGSWLEVIDTSGFRVRLDPTSGRVLNRFKPPVKMVEYCSRVTVSANGKVAASVADDFTVAVWPLEDGETKKPTRRVKK
jgi:WD40 repeat protein